MTKLYQTSIYCLSLLLFVLAACTDEPNRAESTAQRVRFIASLQEMGTRTPYLDITHTAPLVAHVLMSDSETDFSDRHRQGETKLTYRSSEVQKVEPELLYPVPFAPGYFRAVAPYDSWNTSGGNTLLAASPDGCTDLLYSDVATVTPSEAAPHPVVALTIRHAQAMIRVFAQYESEEAKAEWGYLTDLQLAGVNGSTANIPDGVQMVCDQANAKPQPLPTKVEAKPFYYIDHTNLSHTYTDTRFVNQQINLEAVGNKSFPIAYLMTACPDNYLTGVMLQMKSEHYTTWLTTPNIPTGNVSIGQSVDIYLTLRREGGFTCDVEVGEWDTNFTVVAPGNEDGMKQGMNLGLYGKSNSYMVHQANTRYYLNARIQGNGVAPSDGSYTPLTDMVGQRAVVLWSVGGIAADGLNGVITNLNYLPFDGHIYFTTANTPNNGDALIALLDDNDRVLWSWLIWKVNYDPDVTTPQSGVIVGYDAYTLPKGTVGAGTATGTRLPLQMMKYNLGAINTSTTTLNVPRGEGGLFFQWGRKDPFRASGNDLHSGATDVDYAIAHPTEFIGTGTGTWLTAHLKGLWGYGDTDGVIGSKSCFDPCPPGWRVPPKNAWGLKTLGTEATWNGLNEGTILTFDGTHTSWYPATGYLSASNGTLTAYDAEGRTFTTTSTATALSVFSFSSTRTTTDVNASLTAEGYTLRCCRE